MRSKGRREHVWFICKLGQLELSVLVVIKDDSHRVLAYTQHLLDLTRYWIPLTSKKLAMGGTLTKMTVSPSLAT